MEKYKKEYYVASLVLLMIASFPGFVTIFLVKNFKDIDGWIMAYTIISFFAFLSLAPFLFYNFKIKKNKIEDETNNISNFIERFIKFHIKNILILGSLYAFLSFFFGNKLNLTFNQFMRGTIEMVACVAIFSTIFAYIFSKIYSFFIVKIYNLLCKIFPSKNP